MQIRCWIVCVKYARNGGVGIGGEMRSVPMTLSDAWAEIAKYVATGHEAVIECDEQLLARVNAAAAAMQQTQLLAP